MQGSTNTFAIFGQGDQQRVTVVGEVASFINPNLSYVSGAIVMAGSNALVDIAATGVVRNLANDFQPALTMGGVNAVVNNAGQITGGSGVYLAASGTLTNSGRTSGVGRADSVSQGDTAAGVYLRSTVSDAFRIYNTGLIEGAVQGAGAFFAGQRFAILTHETTSTTVLVDNDGRLGGNVLLGDAWDTITNSGVISGSVTTQGENDAIINSGTITGTVRFGEGADSMLMRGAGVVLGSILGEGGADAITGGDRGGFVDGGSGFDTIAGLAGDDTMTGGNGIDSLFGGTNDDSMFGGADNDYVSAGAGNDVLNGGEQNDTLLGGAGDDTLDGSSNDNVLYGGLDDDVIYGGALDSLYGGAGDDELFGQFGLTDFLSGGTGNDSLTGDVGRDTLLGGLGEDVFIYNNVLDSAPLSGGQDVRDRISDFTSGVDVITLSRVDAETFANGNQAFTFIGAAAFTGLGQLRYANGVLSGNVSGSLVADFAIDFTGSPLVLESDIIL